ENWYPAQLEADLEPHGIIYAVDGIPGREPRVFYNRESQTGVLVNTDNYGPLRSLAIGLVSDISSRLFQVNAVRGMSGDIDGQGFILIGPRGTKKTELFFSLMKKDTARLHANDMVFVRFSGTVPMADSAERKLFMPTQAVAAYSPLAPLFDGCKCENVVIRKEDCRNETCLATGDCRLDRGAPFCYDASKKAYAMLDPYWLDGPAKHTKRTRLRWIFILRNDRVSPPLVKAETEDALRLLESGESFGTRTDMSASAPAAFFNPHLLDHSSDNMDGQRQFFRRLLNNTSCYLFNSGVASADDLYQIVSGK
ncbi:MAG: pyridoxal phosphate-dependent aminotransferase, partial [Candidatus Aminicenantes bacterium]|nr:pyridoxal phosphate-dependent aminotransferase [Candidatus Aminicenantes bacterium]